MDEKASQWAEYARLIVLAQQGDKEAYSILLEEISSIVRSFVRSRIKNSSWQEDIVQEILIAIHVGRHTFRPDAEFRPWFFAIMRNKVIDFLRSRNRQIADELLAPVDSVTEECSVELRCDLLAAFHQLTAKQQQLFSLARGEGYSAMEIAATTGSSSGAVKVAVHRVLQSLRSKLAAE